MIVDPWIHDTADPVPADVGDYICPIAAEDFRGHLDREGVKPVRCPARAPNCNAFAERFVRSIKDECLGRIILFGEASLRRALREYAAHYHTERNHQGVGNRLLEPLATVSSSDEPTQCRERLGGMLNYYYREAA
jgi:transposase InsO family protein